VYTFQFWKNGVQVAGVDTADEVIAALLPILPTCLNNTAFLQTNYAGRTFSMKGPWLTLLGLNPTQTYTFGSGSANQQQINLRTSGYDMLNMHGNFCRGVHAAANSIDNFYVVPTNILWSVLMVSNPGVKTYFSNYNSSGKVVYYQPVLEEIEVYFSDEYGNRITYPIDFQMVLTFDFMDKEPVPEEQTIKRARRMNMF
jgi:hypothetical protein